MRRWVLWLIPLGFTAYLAGVLFWDLKYSALDMGDPASQLEQARQLAVHRGWTDQPAQVLPPFLTRGAPKPLLDLALSAGLALGFEPSAAYYHGWIRVFALGFFLFSLLTVQRQFGPICAFIYGAFFISSNAILAHILHGGHVWMGLFFLWLALFLIMEGWAGIFPIFLLIAASLSSHYMYPFLAGVMLVWTGSRAWKVLRVEGSNWRNPREGIQMLIVSKEFVRFIIGASVVFLIAAFLGQITGYFRSILANAAEAAASSNLYPQGHEFLLNLFFLNEGMIYSLFILFLALGGIFFLLKEARHVPASAGFFILLPALVLIYLERPNSLKLGRFYVTLFPFFMIWAAIGAYELLGRIRTRPAAWAGACALGLFMWFSVKNSRAETFRAFHAGKELERELAEKYSAMPEELGVVGMQIPANYFPWAGPETRSNNPARVSRWPAEGKKAVLVSRFSNWNWLGFMDEKDPRVLPVQELYRSSYSYAAASSIEALPFYLFINEGIYFQWSKGKIAESRENRIYKLEDFLNFRGPELK